MNNKQRAIMLGRRPKHRYSAKREEPLYGVSSLRVYYGAGVNQQDVEKLVESLRAMQDDPVLSEWNNYLKALHKHIIASLGMPANLYNVTG